MIVADIDTPIIGMDFLSFYNLLVDPKNKRLIDSETGLSTKGQVTTGNYVSIRTIAGNKNYHRILAEFPEVTRPPGFGEEPVSSIAMTVREHLRSSAFRRQMAPLPPSVIYRPLFTNSR